MKRFLVFITKAQPFWPVAPTGCAMHIKTRNVYARTLKIRVGSHTDIGLI